jgi:hypothetical protein
MGLQDFATGVIVKVLEDPNVQKIIKNLLSDLITEKIAPLIPLAAASAAKAFADLIPGVVHDVSDVVAVADTVRTDLNAAIPALNIGIPVIDDLLNAWRVVL